MNLSNDDYKAMICARADHIRMHLYPQQYGAPIGGHAPGHDQDGVPNFVHLKHTLSELNELIGAFEASLSPA